MLQQIYAPPTTTYALTSSVRYIAKQRELEEVDNALISEFQDFHIKHGGSTWKQKQYQQREKDFAAMVNEINGHIEANKNKIVIANERIKVEKDVEHERQILRLKTELANSTKKLNATKERVLKYDIYRKFLKDVVTNSNIAEIPEVKEQYTSSLNTKREVMRQDLSRTDVLQRYLVVNKRLADEWQQQKICLNNELTKQKNKLEKRLRESFFHDYQWLEVKETLLETQKEVSLHKLAIQNMCLRIYERLFISHTDDTTFIQRLDKIRARVKDIDQVLLHVSQATTTK